MASTETDGRLGAVMPEGVGGALQPESPCLHLGPPRRVGNGGCPVDRADARHDVEYHGHPGHRVAESIQSSDTWAGSRGNCPERQ